MKISALSNPFSFVLETKNGSVFINSEGKGLFSLFLSEQPEDKKGLLHWAGEYEIGGVAAYLVNIGDEKFLGKLNAEDVNFAFFSYSSGKLNDEITENFGSVDILVLEKIGDSNDTELKKFIEKIDPRVIIFCGLNANLFAQKSGFSITQTSDIPCSKSSLPIDRTDFYSL